MIREYPSRYITTPLLTSVEEKILYAILTEHPGRKNHPCAKTIAEMLSLSPNTIRTHLLTMRRKTQTGNMTALAIWGVRRGYQLPEAQQNGQPAQNGR